MTEKQDWTRDDDLPDEEEFFRPEEKPSARLGIGTSGWSYPPWLGSFYAPGTRAERYLEAYAESFEVVEIDSTFYAIPRRSAVEGWAARSPANFRFCPKFPREITHERGLLGCRDITGLFLERMSLLGDKLGPLLIQFAASFGVENFPVLESYLAELPGEFRYAVELRDREWRRQETLDLLRSRNMAWTLAVGPRGEDYRPLTADFAYLRWLGSREIDEAARVVVDRGEELEDWAAWIRERSAELREIYGFFNNHYSGHAPATARQLLSLLGRETPEPPGQRQGDLFG